MFEIASGAYVSVDDLAAANARVAELEHINEGASIATRYVPAWRARVCAHLSRSYPACEQCGRTDVPTEPTDLGNGPVMCVPGRGCWVRRTDRERAVLEACRGLDLRVDACGNMTCYGGHRAVERAELTRREAVK